MPVVQGLMSALQERYGAERGKRVYYAMEASGKGPFAKGNKHHDKHVAFAAKHGVTPIERKKKTPRRKTRGRSRK
jgi:hypothetical protein